MLSDIKAPVPPPSPCKSGEILSMLIVSERGEVFVCVCIAEIRGTELCHKAISGIASNALFT